MIFWTALASREVAMTRPDFAEMAREWLQRTTSITSASPETEKAIAQEFERVWQLGVSYVVLEKTSDHWAIPR